MHSDLSRAPTSIYNFFYSTNANSIKSTALTAFKLGLKTLRSTTRMTAPLDAGPLSATCRLCIRLAVGIERGQRADPALPTD